jgi:hypothetical protein
VDADHAYGSGLLHLTDWLVPQFVRRAPTLIAVNRIEQITNADGYAATTTEHGELLTMDDTHNDELHFILDHEVVSNMRVLKSLICSAFKRRPAA